MLVHHGQWYQSSGGETRPIKDPVLQAQDCKHVLHRLLVQHGSKAATARSAHLVAFPFTDIDLGWSYAGCPRDTIVDRADLAAAAARVRAVIDRHGSGYAPLTGAGLESLVEVLEASCPGRHRCCRGPRRTRPTSTSSPATRPRWLGSCASSGG